MNSSLNINYVQINKADMCLFAASLFGRLTCRDTLKWDKADLESVLKAVVVKITIDQDKWGRWSENDFSQSNNSLTTEIKFLLGWEF